MLNRFSKLGSLLVCCLIVVACANKATKPAKPTKPLQDRQVIAPLASPEQLAAYTKGVDLLRNGDLENARSAFELLLSQEPNFAGAVVNLGVIAARQGKGAEARTLYEKALTINPRNVEALIFLAIEDRGEGLFWDAEEKLLKAASLNQNSAAAHYNLGVLYELYLKDNSKAIKYYQRYVELAVGQDTAKVQRWIKLLERSS